MGKTPSGELAALLQLAALNFGKRHPRSWVDHSLPALLQDKLDVLDQVVVDTVPARAVV